MAKTPPDGPRHGDLVFIPQWADRAQRFFEKVLVHTKGRWARSPFLLDDWQRDDIIRPLFGTARWDDQWRQWVRAYNEAWLEIARKNGKSEILAGVALYLLVADGEQGAEIYGAAKDREQAGAVFGVAAEMVRMSPILRKRLNVIDSRKTITDPRTNSFYRVVASDATGNLGWNPHGVIFDEIIAQPSGDLWDALRRGMGTRTQPLLVAATTAGDDPVSFAATEHDTSVLALDEPERLPNRLVYIRNIPADLDPFDEANWILANPALGSFLSVETLRQEAREAKENPTKEAAFRQFRANQWGNSAARWFSVGSWQRNGGVIVPDDLVGAECFGGLDLAATSDLAALALFFPSDAATEATLHPADPTAGTVAPDERHRLVVHFWAPEAKVGLLDAYTGRRFSRWVKSGLVEVTDGDVIDYDVIHETILEAWERFGLVDVTVDRWNAVSTMNWAQREGIPMVPLAQTFAALSPPSKELERIVTAGALNHGDNPVLDWNALAVTVKRDLNDNIRPIKPNRGATGKRVDGIVATVMAVDGWLRRGVARSAYEDSGIEVV